MANEGVDVMSNTDVLHIFRMAFLELEFCLVAMFATLVCAAVMAP
jgi:hypothetical protein